MYNKIYYFNENNISDFLYLDDFYKIINKYDKIDYESINLFMTIFTFEIDRIFKILNQIIFKNIQIYEKGKKLHNINLFLIIFDKYKYDDLIIKKREKLLINSIKSGNLIAMKAIYNTYENDDCLRISLMSMYLNESMIYLSLLNQRIHIINFLFSKLKKYYDVSSYNIKYSRYINDNFLTKKYYQATILYLKYFNILLPHHNINYLSMYDIYNVRFFDKELFETILIHNNIIIYNWTLNDYLRNIKYIEYHDNQKPKTILYLFLKYGIKIPDKVVSYYEDYKFDQLGYNILKKKSFLIY